MAKKATYDDGRIIECDAGFIGMSPLIPEGFTEYLYDNDPIYSIEDEINGMCMANNLPSEEDMYDAVYYNIPDTGAAENFCAARDSQSSLARKLEIEFIHFGKVDVFPAEAFTAMAPIWRTALIREWRILFISLQTELDCYWEWLSLRNSIWGAGSRFVAWVKEFWEDDVEEVEPEEYDALIDRLNSMGHKYLIAPSQIKYEDIHEAGLEMMWIRSQQNLLSKRCSAYRDQIISGAETSLKIAETTEWAAFKLNDSVAKIAANISYPGSPIAEAVYRLTAVVVPKILGKSVGEWSASIQGEEGVWWKEGTGRKMFGKVSAVLISDGSSILADFTVATFDKVSKASPLGSNLGDRNKVVCKAILRSLIETVFIILDAAIFEKKPPDVLKELAITTAKRCIANGIKVKWHEKEVKAVSDGIANVAEVIVDEVKYAYKVSGQSNVSFADVLMENLFFIIVKCVMGFFIGFLGQKGGRVENYGRRNHKEGFKDRWAERNSHPDPAKREQAKKEWEASQANAHKEHQDRLDAKEAAKAAKRPPDPTLPEPPKAPPPVPPAPPTQNPTPKEIAKVKRVQTSQSSRKEREKRKAKRKMQKESRKKNRDK